MPYYDFYSAFYMDVNCIFLDKDLHVMDDVLFLKLSFCQGV